MALILWPITKNYTDVSKAFTKDNTCTGYIMDTIGVYVYIQVLTKWIASCSLF